MSWPPPTLAMTADEICAQIQIANDYLAHLLKILPRICQQEGHVWDNPAGILVNHCIRQGIWEEADSDCIPRFGSQGGHWAVPPQHVDVFQRICIRCKFIERKEPIKLGVKSPWS